MRAAGIDLSAGHCEVSLNGYDCESPGGRLERLEPGEGVRTRCFVCGQRACKKCSKVTTHPTAGPPLVPRRVRVCTDCEEDRDR